MHLQLEWHSMPMASPLTLAPANGQKGLHVLQAPDCNLPAPDATIYLSMTPEAAAKRGGYGSERYEKVSTCCMLHPLPQAWHACQLDAHASRPGFASGAPYQQA